MKKGLLLIMLTLLVCTGAHAQKVKPVEYGGSVNLIKQDNGGNVLTVRALGYGKNEALAREDAEVRAIRTVLYTGFPGNAALVKEADADTKHSDYFYPFFDNKRYKNYIMSITSVGNLDKVKGQKVKQMPFDIVINRKALRQELVNNKIGRMGFGL